MSLLLGAGAVLAGLGSLANFGLGMANFDYQKDLQRSIFGREDTSIARRVVDLKASGLSPVLAAGQGAGTGSIISTRPPEVDTQSMINSYIALATMQKDFAVKDQQLKVMQSQKNLNDITFAIKSWDLTQYIKSGTASNASGLAKTIRDLWGLSHSSTAEGIINDLKKKASPFPKDYKPTNFPEYQKRLEKMTPAERKKEKDRLLQNQYDLQQNAEKGFFETIFN